MDILKTLYGDVRDMLETDVRFLYRTCQGHVRNMLGKWGILCVGVMLGMFEVMLCRDMKNRVC